MKVLSVRQPWAWAIIHGGKDVENRNWPTNYRGPLAIHAGKQFDLSRDDFTDFIENIYGEPWATMAQKFGPIKGANDIRGAIIGVVDLVDCVTDRNCDSPWKAEGFEFWCWKVENPRALEIPILAKGQLGLFTVPDELLPPEVADHA